MTSILVFDDETVRGIESLYRTDDAIRRRRVVLEALQLRAGERVLDIGTGPGFVACEMADGVGRTGEILGVDSSESMLRLARKRCAEKQHVRFETGDATRLPVPDASFDVAVSVQVYEYISEVATALAELHRVLRPGGRAAIVSTDWESIAWNATDAHRMHAVLAAWAEHCAYTDLPSDVAPEGHCGGVGSRSPADDSAVQPGVRPEYLQRPPDRPDPAFRARAAGTDRRRDRRVGGGSAATR